MLSDSFGNSVRPFSIPLGEQLERNMREDLGGDLNQRTFNKVAVIDDHRFVGDGIARILRESLQFDDVLVFDNPDIGLEACEAETLSLIVADYFIPGFDMLEVYRKFKSMHPRARLLVLTSSVCPQDRADALGAGADEYLEKHAPPQLVIDTIRQLLDGSFGVDASFIDRTAAACIDIGMTTRQVDVLIMLARGHSNKEIARRFDVSPETIKTHISNIYRLTGVNCKSAARDWACENGLL